LATTVPRASSRLGLLRHGDFMKLWTAETISQFGTQVSLLALPLIAALTLNVSPFEFGLLATIEFLPFILLSLPAGVWVDRLRRRPIMIVGDVGRGIALLSIPIAVYLDVLTIWQLYLVGFINGCLTVFFDVAYQSYLPSLVERDDILEGNSKLEISRSAAQIGGPGVAGFLIGIVTAPIAIIVDSISFFVSALLVFIIRRPEPPVVRPVTADGEKAGMRTEVAEGLRYVLRHPYLRYIAACTATSNLFSNVGFGMLLLFLVRVRGFSPETLGITFSLGAAGFLLGALTANVIGRRLGVGPTIIISAVIFGPSFLLVPLAPPDLALPLVAGALFLGSFGGSVYNINQVSFRQAITPERMQGRMNATMRFIVWGTIPIGAISGGFLGGAIGLHETIWIAAIGGSFSFVPLLLSPLLSLKTMPEPLGGETPPGPSDGTDVIGEAVDETPRPVVGSPRASMDDEPG
jgi:MFS family permease